MVTTHLHEQVRVGIACLMLTISGVVASDAMAQERSGTPRGGQSQTIPPLPRGDVKPLGSIPFKKLVRTAAGMDAPRPAAVKPATDPNARAAPEVVAAYEEMLKIRAVADAVADAYEHGNAYLSDVVTNMPWAFPAVEINKHQAIKTIPVAEAPDFAAEKRATLAWIAYGKVYKQFGDPTGRYPDPTKDTIEHEGGPSWSGSKVVGVTRDNRVLATSEGGIPEGCGTRLWIVDATKATVALSQDDEIRRDGKPVGKLGRFSVTRADTVGNVLLIANPAAPNRARNTQNTVLIWNEKAGPRVVMTAGDPIPSMDGWVASSLDTCTMDPEGRVAVTCTATQAAAAHPKTVITLWEDGVLRFAAAEGEAHAGKKLVEVPQPKGKNAKPKPPKEIATRLVEFRLGARTIELDAAEADVDLKTSGWLAPGRFGVYGMHYVQFRGQRARAADCYAINAADGKVEKFETGSKANTWYGPGQAVALIDTWDDQPVAFRVGPFAESVQPFLSFPAKDRLGMRTGQTVEGTDDQKRRLMAAIGPKSAFAVTAYLTTAAPQARPAERPAYDAARLPARGWALFAGDHDNLANVRCVASEYTRVPGTNQRRRAGNFAQLQYARDGTLTFTTDGVMTSRGDGPAIPTTVNYVWAVTANADPRLIVSADDIVRTPKGDSAPLGPFSTLLCDDGRIVITREQGDCVFFAKSD